MSKDPIPVKDPGVAERSNRLLLGGLSVLGLLLLGVLGFSLLREPVQAPTPETDLSQHTTAQFTALQGSVKVKPVGSVEWVNADLVRALQKNDLVRTAAGASAEIRFFDGTMVQVRPDSLITIEESSEDPSTRRRRVAVKMESGQVAYQTGRRNVAGSSTEVATPTLRVVQGELAAGDIRVAQSGDADVRQFLGTGQVQTAAGEHVDLASSQGLRVSSAGRAGPKRVLPSAPTLLAPPHQAEISYPNLATATTLLAWKPVQEAIAYRVVLDYSLSFNRPLVDQRGVRGSSWELHGIDAGNYFWRVAALGEGQVEGEFSEPSRFTVVPAARSGAPTPPSLSIETLDVRLNILQVKGRTAPGASVTVNGQAIEVQTDGSFGEFITLRRTGKQEVVIRATGAGGVVNEERRSVTVAN